MTTKVSIDWKSSGLDLKIIVIINMGGEILSGKNSWRCRRVTSLSALPTTLDTVKLTMKASHVYKI